MTAMGASPAAPARRAHPLLVLLAVLGIVAFLYGVSQGSAARAWGIYLVNLLFWSSLAITGPALAAMIQVTEGRWSPSVKRIALTTAGFLPVSFVLFLVLFWGRATLYPWVTEPLANKAAWLNVPFMSLRIGLGVLILYWVALRLVKAVLVEDQPGGDSPAAVNRRNRLAGWLLGLYVVVLSLWGFDLLMSLDPRWYSGLFGGYYVVTSMYTGFGLVTYLTIRSNEQGLSRVQPPAIQDVAKLTFALSVFWMYFFFSQYLVIWYGNVPVETRYVVRRFFAQPWATIAWAIFIVGWLIPFSYLLKRLTGRPPERHRVFKVILFFGWIAIFFERMLLVFPSVLRDHNTVPVGPVEILVTLGFFALFVLSRNWFLARYKPVLSLPK
jgi:Ni/Fe-hydrogenase subunit HybB-like protein